MESLSMEDHPVGGKGKRPMYAEEKYEKPPAPLPTQQAGNRSDNLSDYSLKDYLLREEPKPDNGKYFYVSACVQEFLETQFLQQFLQQPCRMLAPDTPSYASDAESIATKSLPVISDPEPKNCKESLSCESQISGASSQRSLSPIFVDLRSCSPSSASSSSRTTPYCPPVHIPPSDTSAQSHIPSDVSITSLAQPNVCTNDPPIFPTAFSTPPATPVPSSKITPLLSSLLTQSDNSVSTSCKSASPQSSQNIPSCQNVLSDPNLNRPSSKERLQNQPTPSPSPPSDTKLNLGAREKVKCVIPEEHVPKDLEFKSIAHSENADTLFNPFYLQKKCGGRNLKPLIPDQATPSTSFYEEPCLIPATCSSKELTEDMIPHLYQLAEEYNVSIEIVLQGIYLDQCGSHVLKTGIYTAEERMYLMKLAETEVILKSEPNASSLENSEPTTCLQAENKTTIRPEQAGKLRKGGPYKNEILEPPTTLLHPKPQKLLSTN